MVLVNNEVRRDMWRFVHENAVYPGTMPDGDTIVQVNLSFDREAYSRRHGGDIEFTEVTVAEDGDFVRFYYLPWRAEACFTGRIPRGGPVNYNVFGYRGWLGWWFMYQVVDRTEQRRRPVHTASIYTLF